MHANLLLFRDPYSKIFAVCEEGARTLNKNRQEYLKYLLLRCRKRILLNQHISHESFDLRLGLFFAIYLCDNGIIS